MDADNPNPLTPDERPWALVVVPHAPSPDAAETRFRHMGLRPEPVHDRAGEMVRYRLKLGATTVLAGPAPPSWLDHADPEDRATSLIGVTLPDGWRERGWLLRPEHRADLAPSAAVLADFHRMIAMLIDLFRAEQFFWSPARLWSDADQFRDALAETLAGAMPPVLHLVAFRRRGRDGDDQVATRGLAFLADQELAARIPAGWDMASMVKRLARLAADMMINGPVTRAQRMPGLFVGEWVAMTPQRGEPGGPGTVQVAFRVDR